MADDDDFYGKANGEFVFAERTDATETDPYAALRPEPDATLVIRPETDAEMAARQAQEQPPPAPPPLSVKALNRRRHSPACWTGWAPWPGPSPGPPWRSLRPSCPSVTR
jgi:hypothetical protein